MYSSRLVQSQNTSLRDDQYLEGADEKTNLFDLNIKSNSNKDGSKNHISRLYEAFSKSLPIKIALLLVVLTFLAWVISGKSTSSPVLKQTTIQNKNLNVLNPSIATQKIETQKAQEDNEEQFSLNFVETQFQGKQTEAMLAKAAFVQIQKQFNNLHHTIKSENQQKERMKLLEDITTLEVMIPDRSVPEYVAQHFYHFSVSIHDMILNSNLDKMYRNGKTIFKISLKQHMRAIIRTQLVHNVNFKGQVEVQLSPFDKTLEEKERAIREIMQDQELYYESFYELSKYRNNELRFCILVPSYKNVKSRLYLRNLDSIFMQDYKNYHVVYIDDASPDKTGQFVMQYVQEKEIPSDKIKVYINDVNKKAMYNIYHGIHSYCPDGQVVGIIDGDDSLLGRQVLQLYNAVYQSKRTALIYSNFLKILTNNKTSFGFGTELTKKEFESGKLRHDMSLMGTHFMTFFSDLFKQIKIQDLCYDNGTFYDYAYDRAIITPMLEMAYPRIHYLAEITYEYRNDTGINDGTDDWERVSRLILNKRAYSSLKNFSFIDDFVDNTEAKIKEEQQNIELLNNNGGDVDLPESFFKVSDDNLEKQPIDRSDDST